MAFPSGDFDTAVAAVCHGRATEEQAQALNELLRASAVARDEYLWRVELHARLASEPDVFSKDLCEPARAPGVPRVPSAKVLALPSPPRPTNRRGAWALAVAAGFMLLAAGTWFGRERWTGSSKGATSAPVAMLTRTVEARWQQGARALRAGSALEPGWLRLESGLAQVVFYSGARVVIEGPAELQIVSASEAACPRGRVLAEVPPPARGFRFQTDQASVVDLGTAFGINATRRRTEVHVFQGKVELLAETASKQSLVEGQAAQVDTGAPPRLMAASAAAFSSMFEFQQRSVASEAFRYEQWQFANARLNQDPSLVVHLDFQDAVGADWTLRNAAEKNRSVSEATVIGCQRGEGRWHEKQALEFQSVNDRVLLNVPGEFEALTLAAWVRVRGLNRQFNALFLCDGFEPGTLHWLIRNDRVLGATVFGRNRGELQIVPSPPVLTLDQFGMWLHLALVVDGKSQQITHYVNGTRVSREPLKISPPYRLGAAELGNWNAHRGPDAAANRMRNLSGSLDEFQLFSRALSDAEVNELYAQGKPDL